VAHGFAGWRLPKLRPCPSTAKSRLSEPGRAGRSASSSFAGSFCSAAAPISISPAATTPSLMRSLPSGPRATRSSFSQRSRVGPRCPTRRSPTRPGSLRDSIRIYDEIGIVIVPGLDRTLLQRCAKHMKLGLAKPKRLREPCIRVLLAVVIPKLADPYVSHERAGNGRTDRERSNERPNDIAVQHILKPPRLICASTGDDIELVVGNQFLAAHLRCNQVGCDLADENLVLGEGCGGDGVDAEPVRSGRVEVT
jgi:hypothetical protein